MTFKPVCMNNQKSIKYLNIGIYDDRCIDPLLMKEINMIDLINRKNW